MSWHSRTADGRVPTEPAHPRARRLSTFVWVAALSALCAGCFQPMYADKTPSGAPGLRYTLSAIKVNQIVAPSATPESRLAVELRNQLLFDLTGGSGTNSPTHELTIDLVTSRAPIIVDLASQRPNVETFGLEARYFMKDLASGKKVLDSTTFARVSYDIPGGEQRFVRVRGLRDAENRAAKEVADNIRNRLASYFLAGT